MRSALLVGIITLLAAPAIVVAKSVPPATVIGGPVSCVTLRNVSNTNVLDDSTIDFVMRDGRVFRNALPNSCPQLGFERAFSYQTSINQLCSVDIITVLVQAGGLRSGASCGLGKFTPIAPPERRHR